MFSIIGDLIFLYLLFLSENKVPISLNLHAPNRLSINAWIITSPSEWPFKPKWYGIFIPPKYNVVFFSNLWISNPIPKNVLKDCFFKSEYSVILKLFLSPKTNWVLILLCKNIDASSVTNDLLSLMCFNKNL